MMQVTLSKVVAYHSNAENCVGCRMCVDSCPSGALSSRFNGNLLTISLNAEICTGCGVCVDVCPFNALDLISRDKLKEFKIEVDILRPEKTEKRKYYMIARKVVDVSYCTGCGACTVCPPKGIIWKDGIVDFPDWIKNCRDCAICIKVCQRYKSILKGGLGGILEVRGARSKRFKGQDGAIVSEFIACALEMGVIDTALMVSRDEYWKPIVVHVKHPDQLKNERIAGTKYSLAPVLPELNRIIKKAGRLAIVGTPCIITGLRLLQKEIPLYNKVVLAISLFCMENYRYSSLVEFLNEHNIDIKKVKRFDIRRGRFVVHLDNGIFECSVKDLEEHVSSGCNYCRDFTGVDSDVSVGSAGTPDGYSTILIRSKIAKEIYDYMVENEYVEEIDVDFDAVEKLCKFKIRRAKVRTQEEVEKDKNEFIVRGKPS